MYHYKKRLEKIQNQETPKQICPNCGVDFRPDWGLGKQRRFCGDACRIEWWRDYHKANPSLDVGPKWCEYCGKALNGDQKKYCSRDCYLKAMEETHSTEVCQWCGEEFSVYVGAERKYCSLNCARAARFAPKGAKKGSHRISAEDTETWRRKLTEAARSVPWSSDAKRVWLVCGATSAYTSLDGLASIIKYRVKRNPYDGSIYVFRDQSGRKLRYIEWDGQSFLQGKRNAQYGTYPWPGGSEEETVEISEREFSYLLSDSIVPFKEKK